MLLEKKQEPDPSVLAGIHQYHVAAKLIAKQLQPDHPHSNSDVLFRHITKHFKNPKRPNFTHPDLPDVTVNRYSTHGMDVVAEIKILKLLVVVEKCFPVDEELLNHHKVQPIC